jgi:hypothetical protein
MATFTPSSARRSQLWYGLVATIFAIGFIATVVVAFNLPTQTRSITTISQCRVIKMLDARSNEELSKFTNKYNSFGLLKPGLVVKSQSACKWLTERSADRIQIVLSKSDVTVKTDVIRDLGFRALVVLGGLLVTAFFSLIFVAVYQLLRTLEEIRDKS